MSSGFSGGAPNFYNAGKSVAMNNPQFLGDPASQIAHRRLDLIGKRSLAEFQNQQQQELSLHQQQQALELYLRNVKARTFQQASPISPLSPVDFSASISPDAPSISSASSVSSARYSVPILQQRRQQPIFGVSYQNRAVKQEQGQESDKKMMNRLQELEKQLLDDNDEEETDAVSAVTHSEWSETIQSLISPSQKPISPSPTSSSSSCSSSASPPTLCPKQSISEAAAAISDRKTEVAAEILTRLSQAGNVRGTSEQRLTAYMAGALQSRLNPTRYPPPFAELYGEEHTASTQKLYEASPCFKLGLMAANLAIVEATSEEKQRLNKLHVVDFDIGHGSHYVHLIRLLSSRKGEGSPASLKITTFAEYGSEERLKTVGDWLKALANKAGVSLNFNVLSMKMTDLGPDTLGVEPEESLAVNFSFRLFRLPDESVTTENLRDELLRRVKGLSPRVVTVVEQDLNVNTAPFGARVTEAREYFGALFDSLEATMRDNPDRVRIEEGLGRKASNIVACEGRDRVERCEVFGKWRARMGMAGFNPNPLSTQLADSVRTGLNSLTRGHPGFTVREETGGICLGWMGRTLTVVSAWR
ncbi:scarecrow-like protein 8 [Diospyros lotus]|uniref:scarecrow-like protein 8 n=1 Tax=Diospyros lotus TaxID=55363 RepID=UPI002257D7EC|nr:scarecrow-like protein 8 [Diospyros lotus]